MLERESPWISAARKATRGQTDYRIVTRVREQLNLDTFHPAIQPQDPSAPEA
ncbi:hypothetical protein GCM10017752_00460 [Streptomyces roseoviridis]